MNTFVSPGPPYWIYSLFHWILWIKGSNPMFSWSSLRPPLLIRRGRFSDEDATRMWSRRPCRRLWRWHQWQHQRPTHPGPSLPVASPACPWPLPLWPLRLALTPPRTPASRPTLMTSPSAQPAPSAPPARPSREQVEEKMCRGGSERT